MPQLPELLTKPVRSKPKPKKKPKKKYATAGVLLALLAAFLAMPVMAQEEDGVAHYYPYGAVTVDRLSDLEEWSTGATLGLEVTKNPLYVLVHLDLHDALSGGEDKYPWDTTVGGALGLYKSVEIGGIDVTPSAGLTLKRPSEIEQFTVGFNTSLEAAFDNVFATVGIDWNDILTTTEVYPWDQTVRVALGGYLGDSPEDDAEEDGEEDGED